MFLLQMINLRNPNEEMKIVTERPKRIRSVKAATTYICKFSEMRIKQRNSENIFNNQSLFP